MSFSFFDHRFPLERCFVDIHNQEGLHSHAFCKGTIISTVLLAPRKFDLGFIASPSALDSSLSYLISFVHDTSE